MRKRKEIEREANIVDGRIKDIEKVTGEDTKGRGNGNMVVVS
jgi:hypothetical protein